MADQFLSTMKARRTYYSLKNESTIKDSKIIEIAKEVVLHTPSSLNSQSTRFVILLGEHHKRLWEIAKDCVRAVAPDQDWPADEKKLHERQAAYGTVSNVPS